MGMLCSSAGCCLAQSTSRALKCRQYRLRVCGKVLSLIITSYIVAHDIYYYRGLRISTKGTEGFSLDARFPRPGCRFDTWTKQTLCTRAGPKTGEPSRSVGLDLQGAAAGH